MMVQVMAQVSKFSTGDKSSNPGNPEDCKKARRAALFGGKADKRGWSTVQAPWRPTVSARPLRRPATCGGAELSAWRKRWLRGRTRASLQPHGRYSSAPICFGLTRLPVARSLAARPTAAFKTHYGALDVEERQEAGKGMRKLPLLAGLMLVVTVAVFYHTNAPVTQVGAAASL